MIGIVSGPQSGGGGGTGTVTSVGTSSASLLDATAPNPITNTGSIKFEVQIIDGTYVAIALLELAGGLLEGVTYRITDFNKTIGNGITLVVAEFKAVKNDVAANDVILQPRGFAYSNGLKKYELSYDLQSDFITDLYFADLNQRASRPTGSASNEIETLPWEDTNSTNFYVVESTFTQMPFSGVVPRISKSTVLCSAIDWGFAAGAFIDKSTINPNCTINFVNGGPPGSMNECIVDQNCTLLIESPANRTRWGAFCNQNLQVGSSTDNMRIGVGETFPMQSAQASMNNVAYEGALHDMQELGLTDGGTITITDSYATQIYLHLHPDSAPPVNSGTIIFPSNPVNKQVIHVGCVEACSGLTWQPGVGGIIVDSNVPALAAGQHIAWMFVASKNGWYLV